MITRIIYLFFFNLAFPCWIWTPPAGALLGEEQNNIEVYKKASGGVLNIKSRIVRFDFFFNPVPQEGAGTGFIIDADGHILTNNHVIQGSEKIEATLSDGRIFPAKLVGSILEMDLALIKIDIPGEKLNVLEFGDSKSLNVGDKVLAIGNPFGLQNTLTSGVVSSLDRSVRVSERRLIKGMIQTDASINPGNSGGPLLNSKGQVVGINTAILSPTGASAGIGFAIPSHKVLQILPELKGKGIRAIFHKYGLLIGLILFFLLWKLLLPKKKR